MASETKLNQIIAVRGGVKNRVSDAVTKQYHALQKAGPLMSGHARTYKPLDEEGFVFPPEHQEVQVKAEWVLAEVQKDLVELFDLTAALDWTNQKANADIVLLGDNPVTLLTNVPVTYMMFLEKQLSDLDSMVRRLPVLDPGEVWEYDPNTDNHRTAPVITVKTKKTARNHVKAPATERFAAQVEMYYEDVPVGQWSTVKFSGALPAQKVNKMLMRIDALRRAVKFAREQANLATVTPISVGQRILDFVFTD